jgi:hypothetical protein
MMNANSDQGPTFDGQTAFAYPLVAAQLTTWNKIIEHCDTKKHG